MFQSSLATPVRWSYPEPELHTVSAKDEESVMAWRVRLVLAPLLWMVETHFCTTQGSVRHSAEVPLVALGPLNCCVVLLQVALTYEHEDKSSHHHDYGLHQVCVNHSSQPPCQKKQRQQSVCHHAQGNRNLTWKNAFFSPSPVVSGQTHWEKLALNWSPGAHNCHKPSHEEQSGRFSMFLRQLGGSSAS